MLDLSTTSLVLGGAGQLSLPTAAMIFQVSLVVPLFVPTARFGPALGCSSQSSPARYSVWIFLFEFLYRRQSVLLRASPFGTTDFLQRSVRLALLSVRLGPVVIFRPPCFLVIFSAGLRFGRPVFTDPSCAFVVLLRSVRRRLSRSARSVPPSFFSAPGYGFRLGVRSHASQFPLGEHYFSCSRLAASLVLTWILDKPRCFLRPVSRAPASLRSLREAISPLRRIRSITDLGCSAFSPA
jgi:hypothetical protein